LTKIKSICRRKQKKKSLMYNPCKKKKKKLCRDFREGCTRERKTQLTKKRGTHRSKNWVQGQGVPFLRQKTGDEGEGGNSEKIPIRRGNSRAPGRKWQKEIL